MMQALGVAAWHVGIAVAAVWLVAGILSLLDGWRTSGAPVPDVSERR